MGGQPVAVRINQFWIFAIVRLEKLVHYTHPSFPDWKVAVKRTAHDPLFPWEANRDSGSVRKVKSEPSALSVSSGRARMPVWKVWNALTWGGWPVFFLACVEQTRPNYTWLPRVSRQDLRVLFSIIWESLVNKSALRRTREGEIYDWGCCSFPWVSIKSRAQAGISRFARQLTATRPEWAAERLWETFTWNIHNRRAQLPWIYMQ